MDLFSVPAGAWTPLRRSRAPSPSGCGSPGLGDRSQSSELVAEAARRLTQSGLTPAGQQAAMRPGFWSPRSPRSQGPQRLRPGEGHSGLCCSLLPPPPLKASAEDQAAVQPMAATQMTSDGVSSSLQAPGVSTPPGIYGAGVTTTKRMESARNNSAGFLKAFKGEDDARGAYLPLADRKGVISKGPTLGPRSGSSSPRSAPWAKDDENEAPLSGGGLEKLSDIARSFCQQTELRIEAEQRLYLRPASATTARARSGTGVGWKPTKTSTPVRGYSTRSTFGGRGRNDTNNAAALCKFASEVSRTTPLQESSNRCRSGSAVKSQRKHA